MERQEGFTLVEILVVMLILGSERRQLARLAKWKAARNQEDVDARLAELRKVAEGDANLLPPIKEALRAGGSIGEVCGAMREVFGEYRGGAFF